MTKLIVSVIFLCFLLSQHLLRACPIYLTIALNGKNYYDSNLVINWGPDCYQKPGWIGIFTEDPSVSNIEPVYRFQGNVNASGSVMTNVKVGTLRFPKGWNRDDVNNNTSPLPRIPAFGKGKCLKYFLASFNQNELLSVECLKIQPNWMSNVETISDLPLKELFIPGTHSSGAFLTDYGKSLSEYMQEYVITQNFNVWQQLVFGIRYLDFSIGFSLSDKYDKRNADEFYVVSEHRILNPLNKILQDVRHFVELSHEVVILDFSSFPIGFYNHPERHTDLVRLIYDELDDLIFKQPEDLSKRKKCYDLTLDDIRKTNRYIIVLYPLAELQYPDKESPLLCQTWKKFTTSFMTLSESLDLMRALYSKKNTSLIQDEGWIFHAINSLEHYLNMKMQMQTAKVRAEGINQKVNGWLKGPWGLNANVVTLDYFSSTNLIDVAIYANKQKAFRAKNKNFMKFEVAA